MAAAALTPTVVQKTYIPSTAVTGTPIRLVEYLVKVTKVTQSDWIVSDTYCPGGQVIAVDGNTFDSSTDGVHEGPTYTHSGTKIVLPSATVGTTYLRVLVQLT